MNIWRGLRSVCSEAAAIKLLRCCALCLLSSAPRKQNQAFAELVFTSMETQPACGPKGPRRVHCEMQCFSLPSCEGAVYPLWNLLEKKGLCWRKVTTGQWTAMKTDAVWQEKSCLLPTLKHVTHRQVIPGSGTQRVLSLSARLATIEDLQGR